MITLKLNFRALLRPLCWLNGHGWKDYLNVNAWTSEGRYCPRCGKQQLVRYDLEFEEVEPNTFETIHVRTDWNGTTRFKWESHGKGSTDDPIRLERVEL